MILEAIFLVICTLTTLASTCAVAESIFKAGQTFDWFEVALFVVFTLVTAFFAIQTVSFFVTRFQW